MKKLLPLVVAVMLMGAQGVRAEPAGEAVNQESAAQGGGLSALQEEDRALHTRHEAERVKLREQHLKQKASAERQRKEWQETNARMHQERRAMLEKHADRQPQAVDKEKLLKEADELERRHDAERTALRESLDKKGVSGKARHEKFGKLVAKHGEERRQLHRKHFHETK